MAEVRRVVVKGIDDVLIETVQAPSPGIGEVLVEPTLVGICGSDVHAAHGRHPFVPLPFEPGHEVVGRIVEVGGGVDRSQIGRRVIIDPSAHCGHCEQCQAGRYNICDSIDVFGCLSPGGLTDIFAIPAERTIPIPEDVTDEVAVLTEPMSTPVHAVGRAGDLSGKRVVVVGAGAIGAFIAICAQRAGAAVVVVEDVVQSKLDRALRLGATAVVDSTSPTAVADVVAALGGKAHVVFDTVANEATVAAAIRSLLVKGGRLMLVGVPAGAVKVDLHLVQDNELEIIGNLMFLREDMMSALGILRSNAFPIDEIVSAVFSLEDVSEAFLAADSRETVKVLVRMGSK
jgi:2-desacetyl-2-hydroxyethyl bacteriochlorophyllide A dehydrogenase